jgi:ATP-dependent protease ClpP protease subunit
MHIHITSNINDQLVKKISKELDMAAEYATLTFLINSPGGNMHSADALIQMVRLVLDADPDISVNFIINGQCCSAAVDFVLAFRDNPRVDISISKYTEVLLHKMKICSIDSFPNDLQKIWRNTLKEDTLATINSYKNYITKAQISAIMKGKDVFIDYKVAAKLFNAKVI